MMHVLNAHSWRLLVILLGLLGPAPGAGAAGQAYSLAQVLNNAGNPLHLPPGDPAQYAALGTALQAESRAQLLARLTRPGLTQLEAGLALYDLGLAAGREHLQQAILYYRASADVYLDPFANLTLAQGYFYGLAINGRAVFPKSRTLSFEYLNRGWELGNVLRVNGITDDWPMMVNAGIALGDTFYKFERRQEYPSFRRLQVLRPRLLALRQRFAARYHLQVPDDPQLVYELHYLPLAAACPSVQGTANRAAVLHG